MNAPVNGMDLELVHYEKMVVAIAECYVIDDLKDLENKAMALHLYAKQAKNRELEYQAAEVRLRAERRIGELLLELARTPPQTANLSGKSITDPCPTLGYGSEPSPYGQALAANGISRQAASRYQATAKLSPDLFNEKVHVVITKPKPPPRDPIVADDSLWLWGRMRQFERDKFPAKSLTLLMEKMTDEMREDVRRLAPILKEFFQRLEQLP